MITGAWEGLTDFSRRKTVSSIMLEEGPTGRGVISSSKNVKAKRHRVGLAWHRKDYPGIR